MLKETGELEEWIVASEVHQDGTPHLHAFLKYTRKVDFKVDKWDLGTHHGNYQVAKSWRAVERYCKKDGDYISSIDLHSAQAKKAKNNKELLEMTPKEAVDTGKISLLQLPALMKARGMYMLLQPPKDHDSVKGQWIHGKTGTGKSTLARTENPGFFLKQQNKWWDGYEAEEVVILEDLDHGGACLGHLLKIWADKWSCKGETKGGTIPLYHSKFIVTSQYLPEELWTDDPEMVEAIRRRFAFVHIEQ